MSIRAALAALLVALGGCSTGLRDAPRALVQPVELADGQGALVGTLLFSGPTGIGEEADRAIVDALNDRHYELVLGRLAPDGSMLPDGRFRVPFFTGVERDFVLRARAGRYALENAISIVTTSFDDRRGACRLGRIAELGVRAGEITYVGRVWLVAEYRRDRGAPRVQALRALGVPESDLAEAALELTVGAVDLGDALRTQLRNGEGGRGKRVVTELATVPENVEWECSATERPPAR